MLSKIGKRIFARLVEKTFASNSASMPTVFPVTMQKIAFHTTKPNLGLKDFISSKSRKLMDSMIAREIEEQAAEQTIDYLLCKKGEVVQFEKLFKLTRTRDSSISLILKASVNKRYDVLWLMLKHDMIDPRIERYSITTIFKNISNLDMNDSYFKNFLNELLIKSRVNNDIEILAAITQITLNKRHYELLDYLFNNSSKELLKEVINFRVDGRSVGHLINHGQEALKPEYVEDFLKLGLDSAIVDKQGMSVLHELVYYVSKQQVNNDKAYNILTLAFKNLSVEKFNKIAHTDFNFKINSMPRILYWRYIENYTLNECTKGNGEIPKYIIPGYIRNLVDKLISEMTNKKEFSKSKRSKLDDQANNKNIKHDLPIGC
ncbi:MAG: hypothetical protein J0H68_04865 [Sphingobacteriia bacterium]|nr:hypothetical protein [Sphingobacteriia bacterium]